MGDGQTLRDLNRLLHVMKRGATKLRWTGDNEPKMTGARSAA
jgi:hypothetical protein